MSVAWLLLLVVVCLSRCSGQVLSSGDADMWILSSNTNTDVTNIPCAAYTYAAYNMTNWCQDLTVQVTSSSMLDVIISTEPIRRPTTQNRVWAWTVSPSTPTTLTISMYDPEFVAATYFIGVYPRGQCSGHTSVTLQAAPKTPDAQDNVLVPGVPSSGILRTPNEYRYYQFCVPSSCSSVTVTDTVPRNDAYPIIHISPTLRHPTIYDYTWNAGTFQPAAFAGIQARGHYFVGYYAWCTPSQYCKDNTTCYPCSAYTDSQGVAYNLTLNIVASNQSECQQQTNAIPIDTRPVLDLGTIPTGTTKILSNEYLNCTAKPSPSDPSYSTWRSESFYKIHIDSPCSDIRVSINVKQGEVDLYIGQGADTHPNHGKLVWGSYNWGSDSLFINHSDPNYNPPLDLYIEAESYCGAETSTTGPIVIFDLVIEVIPVETEIGMLSTFSVNANQYDRNHFCVPENIDVKFSFFNNDTITTYPNTYTMPNVMVSRFDRTPMINSRVWHLGSSLHHDNGDTHSLDLLSSNIETLPGVYYLSVYGTCSMTCATGDVTCTPCNHYPTEYGALVTVIPKPTSTPTQAHFSMASHVGVSIIILMISIMISMIVM